MIRVKITWNWTQLNLTPSPSTTQTAANLPCFSDKIFARHRGANAFNLVSSPVLSRKLSSPIYENGGIHKWKRDLPIEVCQMCYPLWLTRREKTRGTCIWTRPSPCLFFWFLLGFANDWLLLLDAEPDAGRWWWRWRLFWFVTKS